MRLNDITGNYSSRAFRLAQDESKTDKLISITM